jgi:hypothetical protein
MPERGLPERIEVVITREATARRWDQLQRSARQQVRSFDRPPYVSASPADNPVEQEILAAGVSYRCVYHPAGFSVPGRPAAVHTLIAAGEQARVTENVPVKMFIADDQLGLLPLEVGGSAESSLIIRASSMLDALIALIELVWERAIAIHADGELPVTGEGPSADEAALLDRLDAGTRFQAGMQAVRRGWL